MNPTETRVESVALYPDRAPVTWRGTASIEGGGREMVIAGLPLELDVKSLRASGRFEVCNCNRTKLISWVYKTNFGVGAQAPLSPNQ